MQFRVDFEFCFLHLLQAHDSYHLISRPARHFLPTAPLFTSLTWRGHLSMQMSCIDCRSVEYVWGLLLLFAMKLAKFAYRRPK